jgi:hypothetical protein
MLGRENNMNNYKEISVSGETWQRCFLLNISNQFNEQPFFEFHEEKVALLSDDIVKKNVGYFVEPLNIGEEFDILNPQTGLPSGQKSTQGQIQLLLTSFYMHCANKRDVALQAEESENELTGNDD